MKQRKRTRMAGLRDIPLPPNIPRPEMWTPQSIVQAVRDGFRFMIPFVWGKSMFSPNAYWITGIQASASGLTVSQDHTPEIGLIKPDDWIRAKTFFRTEMVPREAWAGTPNEQGVVPVYVEIDPATIDWDLLNRGHQIETGPGLGSLEEEREEYVRKQRKDPPKRPPWDYPATPPRPIRHPFRTQEEEEFGFQSLPISFQEETAAEEGVEMPILFYHQPIDPEVIATYVHAPEAPEMTLSDVYDVVHCRGRWERLKSEGYPCPGGDPLTAEHVARAVQFLLSQGFKPLP